MSLKHKLTAGFALIIALLLVTSLLSLGQFESTEKNTNQYQDLSNAALNASQIETQFLKLHLVATQYAQTGNAALVEQVEKQLSLSFSLLEQTSKLQLSAQEKQQFATIFSYIEQYQTAFNTIVSLTTTNQELVASSLEPSGLLVQTTLTNLMKAGQALFDIDIVIGAGLTQESALTAMLYTNKFLISHNRADIDQALSEFKEIEQRASHLQAYLYDEQLTTFERFNQALTDYQATLDQLVQSQLQKDQIVTQQLMAVGANIAQQSQTINSMIKQQQRQLGTSISNDMQATRNILLTLAISAVLIAIAVSVIIYRSILKVVGGEPIEIAQLVEQISQGDLSQQVINTEQTTGILHSTLVMRQELVRIISNLEMSANQVADSAHQLHQVTHSANENAHAEMKHMEQIATAIDELSNTAQQVSGSATLAQDSTSQACQNVDHGQAALANSEQVSLQLENSIRESESILEQLNQYANEIGSVIEVINAVSEQTNLLALNAAIEAARAGEQGRGFAVVAEEVRALAGKTQQSTIDIQQIISNLQNQAEQASDYSSKNIELIRDARENSQQLQQAFSSITASVSQISDINTQVATASEQQFCVTKEISQSVTQTFDMVMQNVEGVKQSTTGSQQLSQLAAEQKQILAFFKCS